MKRGVLIVFLILLTFSAFAAEAKADLLLSTTIPTILRQGFIKNDSDPITPTITVTSALSEDGASFTYVIETNMLYPLTIMATIDPFSKTGGSATIEIANITVKEKDADIAKPIKLSEQPLSLITLIPQHSGVYRYEYYMNVLADQEQVEEAESGEYTTTMSIEIQSDN